MTMLPHEIEAKSFEIITQELGPIDLPEGELSILKRVIHTTADFEYAQNLVFSEGVVEQALTALRHGATIITDTQMGASGINKRSAAALGVAVHCFIADEDVARAAKEDGTTRAVASMKKAFTLPGKKVFAIGNAPTALMQLLAMYKDEEEEQLPAAIIGVPVGFVNVVESKEMLLSSQIATIVARGRKGGSNVAAAICNALLYQIVRTE